VTTLFEKISQRELPAEFLYEDDRCFVIRDIVPLAPVHLLIIPRKALVNLYEIEDEDVLLLGHLLKISKKMAEMFGDGNGFRIVINSGKLAGQIVPHLHLHLLTGKSLSQRFS
jgi:histidine triad (HIT) family protein